MKHAEKLDFINTIIEIGNHFHRNSEKINEICKGFHKHLPSLKLIDIVKALEEMPKLELDDRLEQKYEDWLYKIFS